MRYVLIGNSIASANAVAGIRDVDPEGEIVIVDAENTFCYSRPLISYYLAGEVPVERMAYRPREFFDLHRAQIVTGKVEAIRPDAREIDLDSGDTLPYDRVLVSTGGVPFVPPIDGLEGGGVFTFTTLTDARALEAVARPGAKAVVLGGGLIGVKAAHALIERGVEVAIVELGKSLMPLALDEVSGRIVSENARSQDIELFLEDTVSAVQRNEAGDVVGVELASGTHIPCEFLVVAVGVRPNAALVSEAGAAVERGVVVDRQMKTSIENVYAAGDVAQGYNLLTGENQVIAILPVAAWQGYAAGRAMAGDDYHYAGGMPMNSVDVFGIPIISVGLIAADGFDVYERLDEDAKVYRRFLVRDGRLYGAILVNEIDRAGILTGLIKHGDDVGSIIDKLLDGTPSFAVLPKGLRKGKLFKKVLKEWAAV